MYTSGLSNKQQASSRPHFRAVRKVNVRTYVRTKRKFETHFIRSTQKSWPKILVTIRGKTWQAQLGNWQKSEFAHL